MLPQIINEYKQTNLMNNPFMKKYRISIVRASASESGSSFFPSNRTKRIVAVVKTFRHYALDNFFWPELWHCSKQNLLKCGKRPKTIQYILWKHSVEHIVLKGFFIKMGSTFINAPMLGELLYLNCIINITFEIAAWKCRQILKWAVQGTSQEVGN